jgi:hypothetical protein
LLGGVWLDCRLATQALKLFHGHACAGVAHCIAETGVELGVRARFSFGNAAVAIVSSVLKVAAGSADVAVLVGSLANAARPPRWRERTQG